MWAGAFIHNCHINVDFDVNSSSACLVFFFHSILFLFFPSENCVRWKWARKPKNKMTNEKPFNLTFLTRSFSSSVFFFISSFFFQREITICKATDDAANNSYKMSHMFYGFELTLALPVLFSIFFFFVIHISKNSNFIVTKKKKKLLATSWWLVNVHRIIYSPAKR